LIFERLRRNRNENALKQWKYNKTETADLQQNKNPLASLKAPNKSKSIKRTSRDLILKISEGKCFEGIWG